MALEWIGSTTVFGAFGMLGRLPALSVATPNNLRIASWLVVMLQRLHMTKNYHHWNI